MLLPDDQLRCNFRAVDGKRCRSFRFDHHPSLCAAHARRTRPAAVRRHRDLVVLQPPSLVEIHRMIQQGIRWMATQMITLAQCDRLVRCINRVRRRRPFAALELADVWQELCDTVEARLNGGNCSSGHHRQPLCLDVTPSAGEAEPPAT